MGVETAGSNLDDFAAYMSGDALLSEKPDAALIPEGVDIIESDEEIAPLDRVESSFDHAAQNFPDIYFHFYNAVHGDEDLYITETGGTKFVTWNTGVLPAPKVWQKADGTNNMRLKAMRRESRAFRDVQLKTAKIA